jgi:hypothetical protein
MRDVQGDHTVTMKERNTKMSVKMRIAAAVAGLLGLAAALAPAVAAAGVADCGMITNIASVTYTDTFGVQKVISWNVTAMVMVASPNMIVNKTATPTLQGAGGIVNFCISFQNLSYCASAIDVTIWDKVPDSMNYMPASLGEWTNGAGTMDSAFGAASPPGTVGEPAAYGQYYLRWGYNFLGPRESGVICYRATVL